MTKAMVDLASSKGNKEMQSILKSGPRKSSESDDAKKGKNKSNSKSNSKSKGKKNGSKNQSNKGKNRNNSAQKE